MKMKNSKAWADKAPEADMASEEMDQHEVFENTFFHFIKALRVLLSDAATQCESMDNFNAP
jgi:hypothetical protein